MRILKKLFLFLIILLGIILIAAAFMKKDFAVEKEIVINQPKDSVFKFVKFLKNQDQFSVWAKMDPNMKNQFKGNDGEIGAINSWESDNENVGIGEQEIKNIKEGERIDFELRFKEPMEATNFAYMTTEALSPTQTKVIWGFTGKSPYPFNFMLAFMNMDEMVGKDFQQGLDNLKVLLEKK